MGPAQLDCCSLSTLEEVLRAGDVASVIFWPDQLEETAFQKQIEPYASASQQLGTAVVVAKFSRVAGRIGADGLMLGADIAEVQSGVEKFAPTMMVGTSNVKNRHSALVLGEARPDFIMFGKPGGDIRPEPHPKNLDLGRWWAQMVEIPCIVMGGRDLNSVIDVARSGAEFVALGDAIFAPELDATTELSAPERVQLSNQLLDEHAPRFETFED